jgi:ectoine hydroxylase-related dioxygenase (phytanoyl-CoA dioxygenase family)
MEVYLDGSQVAAFGRDGYLMIESVFDEGELAEFRDASDRIVELSINSTLALGRRHPRLDAKVHDDGRVTVRKLQPINDLDPRLAAIASDERLVGPMRQLMGDEPILMEEKLNPKQTLDTRGLDLQVLVNSSFNREIGLEGFHLHHDWGYYRQQGYPSDTLSSAVVIDGCAGRGPLRVIPGSHLIDAPLVDDDPSSGSGVIADGFFSPDELVPLDAPAGSVLLFHAKLVHDSEPNRSGQPRRVMIYSHYPRSHDPEADPDRRNGPVREYARSFEDEYRGMVRSGAFEPPFSMTNRLCADSDDALHPNLRANVVAE